MVAASNWCIIPGMVATKTSSETVIPCQPGDVPYGIFNNFVGGSYDEVGDHPDVGVWRRGAFEFLNSTGFIQHKDHERLPFMLDWSVYCAYDHTLSPWQSLDTQLRVGYCLAIFPHALIVELDLIPPM